LTAIIKLELVELLEKEIDMAQIRAESERAIKTLLVNWWTSVNQQLAAATGKSVQIGEAPVDVLYNSEVGTRLQRIAAAGENSVSWSKPKADSIISDCDLFEAWLKNTPFMTKTPEEFWKTPVGYIVLNARLWAEVDKLISVSQAADISGLSLSTLSQRVSRGTVEGFEDPFEPNPRRSRRIRHSTAIQLKQVVTLEKEIASKRMTPKTPISSQAIAPS
jgi:hypothetical protein